MFDRLASWARRAGRAHDRQRRHSLIAIVCSFSVAANIGAGETTAIASVETVASGLVYPWGIDFFPNGDAIVSEMVGRIQIFRKGWATRSEVAGLPKVRNFFDVAVYPDFARSPWIYFAYSTVEEGGVELRVMRGQLHGDELGQLELVFRVAPTWPPPFSGGRLLFLDSQTLLLSVGDRVGDHSAAQDEAQLFGKIIRIPISSSAAVDGISPGQPVGYQVYSLGHRNVQGLAIDPLTGAIWASEHGPIGGDELNRIELGANYGWPMVSSGQGLPSQSRAAPEVLFRQPGFVWEAAVAPSGIAAYVNNGSKPAHTEILIATLRGTSLRRLKAGEGGRFEEQVLLTEFQQRLRDVSVDSNGAIYVLTDSPQGKVLRIRLH
jgi:glucose/arabinose dehydrogenase